MVVRTTFKPFAMWLSFGPTPKSRQDVLEYVRLREWYCSLEIPASKEFSRELVKYIGNAAFGIGIYVEQAQSNSDFVQMVSSCPGGRRVTCRTRAQQVEEDILCKIKEYAVYLAKQITWENLYLAQVSTKFRMFSNADKPLALSPGSMHTIP